MSVFYFSLFVFFFFNDPATTEIYTLSLHDALPISMTPPAFESWQRTPRYSASRSKTMRTSVDSLAGRSEEHTSELQSLRHLVCRLLLEKKKKTRSKHHCRYISRDASEFANDA